MAGPSASPVALTDRQRRFVAEYLIDLNATQAAIRAGYSVKSADKIGPELLGKTRVGEAIRAAQSERSERTEITQDRVLEELAALAFAHMGQFATWSKESVSLKDSTKLDPRAVSEVKQSVKQFGTDIGIKLHDKLGALKLLGQHLGMFDSSTDPDSTQRILITEVEVIAPPPSADVDAS